MFPSLFYSEEKKKKPFFIISLDGGGVRGAFQCDIIGRIFKKYPFLEKKVDMYAGSSVGAFLASGLATRPFEEAQHCCTEKEFEKIFKRTWEHSAVSIDGLYEAKYSNVPVKKFCDHFFKDLSFKDAEKHLLVTSFRVGDTSDAEEELDPLCSHFFQKKRWQPVVYHNLDSKNQSQLEKSIGDSLMQSSAAPGFFPIHQKCIDGGILANNPSMLAISYAKRFNLVESLDDIVLLSIGTGKSEQNMSFYGSNADLGLSQWFPHITDLLMQSNSECSVIECASLLEQSHFCRIQPILDVPIPLDDYRKIPFLKKMANEFDLSEVDSFIEQHFL